jgi:hypothetical protein
MRRLRDADDDPPPDALLAAARSAYSWRTAEGQLTPASYDSLLDEALTAVRSGAGARLLSFGDDELAVDVEVSGHGATRSLLGQLSPATAAEVTVRHGGAEEATVTADALGRFVVEAKPGPLSIRCAVAGSGLVLHTDWVLV